MTDLKKDSTKFYLFHLALLLLVAAAIVLRLAVSLYVPRVIKWDEPVYLLLGYNLLAGNGFTYTGHPELHFTPLYPAVAGIFHLLTGDYEKASNLAYALFGGLLLVPVFVIAQKIYGVKTAWLATVLTAVFPALNVSVLFWGTLTEPLYLFLLYGALAFLLLGLEHDSLRMFPAAGTLLGLAYLTRPEAVVYVGVFFVFVCMWLLKAIKRARTWYALASFILPFVLMAVPYIGYLHVHTGQWMISGKVAYVWQEASASNAKNKFGSNLMPGGETAWISPERFEATTLPSVQTNPEAIWARVIKNVRKFKGQFFEGGNFWWGLSPLVVIALFKQPWDRLRLRREAFLITIICVLMLTFLPVFYQTRFFAPAFPVLLIWTAQGAIYLGGWIQDTVEQWSDSLCGPNIKLLLRWLPASITTSLMIFMIPSVAQGWIATTFYGEKEAGLWLRLHTPLEAIVMTEELGVALYANRRWVDSPRTDWISFLRYTREKGVNFFVVRNFKLDEQQPELARILQKGTPQLELVSSFEEAHMAGSVKTLVYRLSNLSSDTTGWEKAQ